MSEDPKRSPAAPHLQASAPNSPTPLPPAPAPPPLRPNSISEDDLFGNPASPRPHDDFATVKVQLLDTDGHQAENTPPPLPPSPASAAAEVWFEEAPTRPSLLTDLAPSVVRGPGSGREVVSGELAETSVVPPSPPDVQHARSMRLIAILSVATALVVGLIIGALLFRGKSGDRAAESAACSLAVESDPPGATVLLNGTFAGVTPADVASAPCGAVSLRLEKPSFAPWELAFTLTSSTKPRLSASLKPNP